MRGLESEGKPVAEDKLHGNIVQQLKQWVRMSRSLKYKVILCLTTLVQGMKSQGMIKRLVQWNNLPAKNTNSWVFDSWFIRMLATQFVTRLQLTLAHLTELVPYHFLLMWIQALSPSYSKMNRSTSY